MSKKNFTKSLMQSEDVQAMTFSGMFYDADDNLAECHNGAIVKRGEMLTHSVYTTLKDPNMYKITSPAADTDEIGIVDYVGVSGGNIAGVYYKEGIKTYGLVAPAGTPVRVRRLAKHDTGYFDKDNFATAPADGALYVPTAGSTIWTAVGSTTIPVTKTCVKVGFSKAVTEGAVNTSTEYFVEFVNVV